MTLETTNQRRVRVFCVSHVMMQTKQTFKNFRRKSDDPKADQQNNTEKVNSILYRRPSFVLTSSMNDIDNGGIVHEGNKSLKPPDAINLTPPSPAPSTTSFLKAPGFLKVV